MKLVDVFFGALIFSVAVAIIFLTAGCATGNCWQHDDDVPNAIKCEAPNEWLEQPPCWARQAEDRIVRTWEANYGPLTASERACVADYWFAVLPADVWRGDYFRFDEKYPQAVGLHMPSGIIYIAACRPEREPDNCYSAHADIHRHEVLHGIHQCTGSLGSRDHSSVAWRLLGALEPGMTLDCIDDSMSSYCDLPGRECYEY